MARGKSGINFPVKFLAIAIVMLGIPLTLFLSKQEQDIRLEASKGNLVSSKLPAACNDNVEKATLEGDCGPVHDRKFKSISFECQGGETYAFPRSKDTTSCRPAADWLNRATAWCRQNTQSCLVPTPTPCTKVFQTGFTYGPSCQGGYKSVNYTCSDDYTGTLQADGTRCVSAAEWNRKVRKACNTRGSCYEQPPTPTSCTTVKLAEDSGPSNRCKISGYKTFTVVCSDEYTETLTDNTGKNRCTSLGEWQTRARNLCFRRSSC